MATEKAELNVVSDDEDRGPLVEDEALDVAKASIADKLNGLGDSPEDVLMMTKEKRRLIRISAFLLPGIFVL